MIFQRKVTAPRDEAVRAGWNDAAWGRPHRQIESALLQSYESGYTGGLVFREKRAADLLQRADLGGIEAVPDAAERRL